MESINHTSSGSDVSDQAVSTPSFSANRADFASSFSERLQLEQTAAGEEARGGDSIGSGDKIPTFPGQLQALRYADAGRECLMVRIRANATWPMAWDQVMQKDGWYLLHESGRLIRHYVRTWNAPQDE